MTDNQNYSVWEALGEDGFTRLVAAFYRSVDSDPVLRALYPEPDLEPAERRMRMFLIQYWGGPTQYSQERGHPRLRMRHAPFVIGPNERDAWLKAMIGALDETHVPEPAYSLMRDYFERAAEFMMNAPYSG
jgi:hemoglobin